MLPTLPGIDPLLCLFVCVDGKPYAQLQEPLNLLRWSEDTFQKEGERDEYFRLPLTSAKHTGRTLKVRSYMLANISVCGEGCQLELCNLALAKHTL